MNPYQEIRKVPLDYSGIKSSAYAVQRYDEDKGWKEAGVVGANYMLLPNQEVKDIADDIVDSASIDFEVDKEFFNGKNYMLSYRAKESLDTTVDRNIGDLNLGIQFWNSYDGSRSLSFELFLNRLVCMNGMVTRKNFVSHRFKHDANSIGWKDELEKVTDLIHNVPMDNYLNKFRLLAEGNPMDCNDLSYIRGSCLPKVPTSTWGKILDKMFRDKEYDEYRPWDLLNASTNVLWHNKKQTISDFNMNGYIVEGMCNYVT